MCYFLMHKRIAILFKPLIQLLVSNGPLRNGSGHLTSVIALVLAILSVLSVFALHFPEYLTTPEVRRRLDVDLLRQILLAALVIAGTFSVLNFLLGHRRWLASVSFSLVLLATALGGHAVRVDPDFPNDTPYIGLDWFVLDLLASSLLFIFIEKLRPLRSNQPVFRSEWQTDLAHFALIHLFVGLLMAIVNSTAHGALAVLGVQPWHAMIGKLGWPIALPLCILLADLVQYAIHRSFHEIPLLWRFHSIHHSVKTMDWLAGSRLHLLEVLLTRSLVLTALLLAGFSKGVIDAYILIVGFHAVLNHSNVNLSLGPLSNIIVTPAYHHWHHACESIALNRNYAAHLPIIDRLLGTQCKPETEFPTHYGIIENDVPQGFWAQCRHPFR
jgi:sterol desaturase/sphingolipid hydroxylase (fatty acid hydroxylase superfamily)